MRTSDLYQKAQALFAELCDLDEENRAARLEEINDDGLRDRVARMLRQDDQLQASESSARNETVAQEDTAAGSGEFKVDTKVPAVTGYQLSEPLGEGGMGLVWRATQNDTKREVAIKFVRGALAGDVRAMARFHREIELVAKLSHPNIVKVFHSGIAEDAPFYVMELVSGVELGEYVQAEQPMIPEILTLMATVCDAIQHAHQNGVIHRDLKPSNILVTDAKVPYVVDFGIAASENDDVTQMTMQGQLIGTPAYMSPEQASGSQGRVDSRSDVFTLGVITYQLITGQNPHDLQGSQLDVVRRIADGEIRNPRKWVPGIDRDLESVLLKCLDHDRERRYGSASEFAAELRRLEKGLPVIARPIGVVQKASRFCRRRPAVAGLIAIAAVLFGVLAVGGPLVAINQARLLGQIEDEQTRRDAARLETLLTADIRSIPALLQSSGEDLIALQPVILQQLDDASLDEAQSLRLKLALVGQDPAYVPELVEQLWKCSPTEFLTIRSVLRPYSADIAEDVWQQTASEQEATTRFRAACALASFAPQDQRWEELASFVIDRLLQSDTIELGVWAGALEPSKHWLRVPLSEAIAEDDQERRSLDAARVARNYFREDLPSMVRWLGHANDAQFLTFFEAIQKHERAKQELADRVHAKNDPVTAASETLSFRDVSQERQLANWLIALIRLGETQVIGEHLAASQDPTTASWIVTRMAGYQVDVEIVAAQLFRQQDPSVIRALLLALGNYRLEAMPVSVRETVLAHVAELEQSHPDPGVHAAASWSLARWDVPSAAEDPAEKRKWVSPIVAGRPYSLGVAIEGHEFVSFHGPMQFTFGSPADERNRRDNEFAFPCVINRNYAIGTHEVTHEQWLSFLKETNRTVSRYVVRDESRYPQTSITWHSTAAYCNWLSKKEGLPESEWCYVIGQNGTAFVKRNALDLIGYRLPTEAEWEYACRAQTNTTYSFGNDVDLLDQFGWSGANSSMHYQIVGQLAPNAFGLFDMHGNAKEMCLNEFRIWRDTVVKSDDQFVYPGGTDRVFHYPTRGGSYFSGDSSLRSAARVSDPDGSFLAEAGFRIAKTVRSAGREKIQVRPVSIPPPKPAVVDGRPAGRSLQWNGSAYVAAPGLPFAQFPAFTIEMWVQGWKGNLINQGRNLNDPRICIYERGAFWKDKEEVRTGFSDIRVSTNKTHHRAFVFDGKQQLMFVDGKLVAKNVTSEPMPPIDRDRMLRIGSIEGFSGIASGEMYGMRVSSIGRYTRPFVPPPVFQADDDTELLYDFSQVTGDRVFDQSFHERHGKIVVAGDPRPSGRSTTESPVQETHPVLKQGLRLQAAGHHVRAPGIALHKHQAFTIEGWVRGWHGPLAAQGSAGSYPRIAFAALTVTMHQPGSKLARLKFADKIPGRLHHRAYVVEGNHHRVFIEGELAAEGTFGEVPAVPVRRPFLIGQIEGAQLAYAVGEVFLVEVSSVARYDESFDPTPRLEPDEHTLRLYDFSMVEDGRVPDLSPAKADGQVVEAAPQP